MAFPGDVDRPKVAGCLALIRDGAILVRGAADVLTQLGLTPARPTAAQAVPDDPVEARILELLAGGPADADMVAAAGEVPAPLALARIGDLLAAGKIAAGPDGRFRRSAS
jgi:DNA processing protein